MTPPARGRVTCAVPVAAAVVLLVGCGGPSPVAQEPAAAGPSATSAGLRLTVTGVHLLPLAGTPGADAAQARLGVPAAELAQVHLLLAVRDEGAGPAVLADDDLTLAVGGRSLPPSTADTFPDEALEPGEELQTAVGFDVPLRDGAGAVLRWTHAGTVVELPVGDAPVGG